MAGDPRTAVLLVGLGVDELSMSTFELPRVKAAIRCVTLPQAQQLAEALVLPRLRPVAVILGLAPVGLGVLAVAGAGTGWWPAAPGAPTCRPADQATGPPSFDGGPRCSGSVGCGVRARAPEINALGCRPD